VREREKGVYGGEVRKSEKKTIIGFWGCSRVGGKKKEKRKK